MSKYCMQCGKEIDSKDQHCQYCGASQENDFGVSKTVSAKSSGSLLVPIVAVLSVILVIIIVVVNLTIFNNGYKEPLDNLMEAIKSGEADYIEDALPDYITESDKYKSEDMDRALKLIAEAYGDDFDISYKVIDKKGIDSDDLDKLEDKIDKEYDESVDVEAGYKVKIEVTARYKGEKSSKSFTIPVYEIDGEWCITDTSLTNLI